MHPEPIETSIQTLGEAKIPSPMLKDEQGGINHLFAMSQFTRSMAVLLGAGTPMVPALETAATSIGNSWIAELFLD